MLNIQINKNEYSKENLNKLEKAGFDINLNNVRQVLGQSEQKVEDFINQVKIANSKKIDFELSSNEPTQKIKMFFKTDYCHDFSYERSFKSFLSALNKISVLFFENNQIFKMHCLFSNPKNWSKFCELTKSDLLKYQDLRLKELTSSEESKETIFQIYPQRSGTSLNNIIIPVNNSVYGVFDGKKFISSIIVSKREGGNHSDSQIEQNFLNYWNTRIKENDLFLLRNGTNNEQDFRISYFDKISKKEKGFFPDLLLIRKNKKGYSTIIADIKSEAELKNIIENNELFCKQESLFNYTKTYSSSEHLILGAIIIEIKGSNGLSSFKIFDKMLSIKELNKGDYSSGIDLDSFLSDLNKKKVA